MFSKLAVEKFLARDLETWDWVKNLSDTRLDKELSLMDPAPEFVIPPWRHQKEMFYLGALNPNFLYFADMGLGKTAVILALVLWRKRRGDPHRMLVLVPNVVNIQSWVDDCEKHTPALEMVPLWDNLNTKMVDGKKVMVSVTDARVAAALSGRGDIVVVNYAGAAHMVSTKHEVINKSGKASNKLLLDIDKVATLTKQFKGITFDETQNLRTWNSLWYLMAKHLGNYKDTRYGLTGTVVGRDPLIMWPQFYCVDKGASLGWDFGLFKQTYFDAKAGYWGGVTYKVTPRGKKRIAAAIKHRSIRYHKDQCLDIPPKIPIQIHIPLPKALHGYVYNYMETIKRAEGNVQEMRSAFTRLRQISSGFVGAKDDEDGDRLEIDLPSKPKLEPMMEIIRGLPVDVKFLVFYEFTFSGKLILEQLKSAKIDAGWVSGVATDPVGDYNKFRRTKECRGLVIQSRAGAGLDLPMASYEFFYENSNDPIVRLQCEDRAHRGGQVNSVTIYDFIVKETLDQKLLGYIQEGKDMLSLMMGDKKGKRK